MILLQQFLVGFIASVFGSLPPGMISLTVLDVSVKKSIKDGFYVALAASIVEYFQCFLAIMFSSVILKSAFIHSVIIYSAIPVFIALALYFFFRDKVAGKENQTPGFSSFSKGLLIGALNMLAIPFWIFWSSYFAAHQWINFQWESLALFSLGVSLGTLIVLIIYGKLGTMVIHKLGIIQHWVSRSIALIFLALAVYQLFTLI